MDIGDFIQHLENSQSEDNEISLASWSQLKGFRDEQLPQLLEYTSTILYDPDINCNTKGLAMLLFIDLYDNNSSVEYDPIPPEVFPDFLQALLSLFETENLQVVSIAATLVFKLVSSEMHEDTEIPIVHQFADSLQNSESPYTTFAFSSVLFQICQEFTLSVEDNFMVLSAVLQQLSSGTLPAVVASCVIALFRLTIPSLSPEFIESQLFLDLIEMLLGLTSTEGIETESILTWSEIISCRPVQEEVLEKVSGIVLEYMTVREEPALLVACCVFWGEVTTAFMARTEIIAPFDHPLFLALFRILCLRGSVEVGEIDEVQQTAARTLQMFTRITVATSAFTLLEFAIEKSAEVESIVEQNAVLECVRIVAKYGLSNEWDDIGCIVDAALRSEVPLIQFQGLRIARAVFKRLSGEAEASLILPLVEPCFAFVDASSHIATRFALLLGPLCNLMASGISELVSEDDNDDKGENEGNLSEFIEVAEESASALLELVTDSDLDVASAAFDSLYEIGECQRLSQIHEAIVPHLLGILEEASDESIEYVVDVCITITPYIETMKEQFEQFAERAVELLTMALAQTQRALQPLAAISLTFPAEFEPASDAVLEAIIASIAEDASDDAFAEGADATNVKALITALQQLPNPVDPSEFVSTLTTALAAGLVQGRGPQAMAAAARTMFELRMDGFEVPTAELGPSIRTMAAALPPSDDESVVDCGVAFLKLAAAVVEDSEGEVKGEAIDDSIALCELVCAASYPDEDNIFDAVAGLLRVLAAVSEDIPKAVAEGSAAVFEVLRSAAEKSAALKGDTGLAIDAL